MIKKEFNQIIIGGLQRSGTSLLRAIVGSHSEIAIFEWDLQLWVEFYPLYKDKKLNAKRATILLDSILATEKIQLCIIPFERSYFITKITEHKQPFYFEDLYVLLLEYYHKGRGRKYIGLKTPHNEFYADDIFERFPNTKFIHILRNPLDVAVSLKEAKNKWWGGEINYYSHVHHWEYSATKALERLTKYKDRYFVMRYEDLISQPEQKTQEICTFLDVDYEETMLQMQGHPGWEGGNSSFAKGKKAATFSTSSINRYKDSLDQNTQDIYVQLLGDLLKQFDYLPATNTLKGKASIALNYKLHSSYEQFYEQTLIHLKRSGTYPFLYKIKSALIRK